MSSVLRRVRKRKKARRLGRVDVMRREDYAELDLDPKVELIRSLVPLGLMHVEELLDEEVTALAGARCARISAATSTRSTALSPARSSTSFAAPSTTASEVALSKRSKASTATVVSPRKRISASSMAAWAFASARGALPPCMAQTA